MKQKLVDKVLKVCPKIVGGGDGQVVNMLAF